MKLKSKEVAAIKSHIKNALWEVSETSPSCYYIEGCLQDILNILDKKDEQNNTENPETSY
jgi:hypothetical protein